jgi:UV DNA damage endonuclease
VLTQAKDKEQAVFDLYRIYGLEETIKESLRPPKNPEEMTLATNGRKSNKAVAKQFVAVLCALEIPCR